MIQESFTFKMLTGYFLYKLSVLGVFIIVVEIFGSSTVKTEELVLNTEGGTVIGTTDTVEFNGKLKPVTRFLGIPYAKPPVGERRFSKPEPYGNFTTPWNATYHRPHCMQTQLSYQYIKDSYKQSEDCLYLNIYVPDNSSFSTKGYAVMVYIHGGSFVDGGADVYDGNILAGFHETVIVSLNYRLNIFGFLSDGMTLRGNFGLWDMRLAIQWVHDNIRQFAGDPDRVTLFGQSAGGAAVEYQAIYPQNRGLFRRIIAQSGSSFAYWAYQKTPLKNFLWFTSTVGCNQTFIDDIMDCLREKPAEELQLEENEFTTQFLPTVDYDFLPEDPVSLSEKTSEAGKAAMDHFSEIDFLSGVTSSDGAVAVGFWAYLLQMMNETNTNLAEGVSKTFLNDFYIPQKLSGVLDDIPPLLLHAFQYVYTDWSNEADPKAVRDKLLEFESDVIFNVPSSFTLRVHEADSQNASKSNYFYVFDHKPGFAPAPGWLTGATHAMDLPYVFGFTKGLQDKLIKDFEALPSFPLSQEDLKFSEAVMIFWTNFAKTGNPNQPVRNDDVNIPEWPPFDTKDKRYLELKIRMTSDSVKHSHVANRIAFWEDLAPAIQGCEVSSGTYTSPASSLLAFTIAFCVFVISSN